MHSPGAELDDQPEITDVMENEESNLCDTEEADDGTVVETPTLTEEVNDVLSQLASSSNTVGDALPSETLLKHPWAPNSADLPSIVLTSHCSLNVNGISIILSRFGKRFDLPIALSSVALQ